MIIYTNQILQVNCQEEENIASIPNTEPKLLVTQKMLIVLPYTV